MSEPSTPSNNSTQDTPQPPTLIKRLINPLVIMLVLFGFPYIASWYFLNSDSSISLGQLSNHGELLSPVLPLGEYSLETHTGSKISNASMAGNWLLFMSTSSCTQVCQDTLLLIRQARKSTGINRKVIKPILLLKTPEALSPFKVALSEAFPQLSIVGPQSPDAQALIATFTQVHANTENSIFMVDPYNNLMMYYPEGTKPKALMEDLERLMKVNKPKL